MAEAGRHANLGLEKGELMDDLDRQIEEAVRLTRRRVWQGRLATIASTGALLVIGIGGTLATYQLFPDREERALDAVRREQPPRSGEAPLSNRWNRLRLLDDGDR